MYETPKIFEYNVRMIWVMRVIDNIYYINGCYIAFSESQDITDISVLAKAVDDIYSPRFRNATKTSMLIYTDSSDPEHLPLHVDVTDLSLDLSNTKNVLCAYREWVDSIDPKLIYINDHRNEGGDINAAYT